MKINEYNSVGYPIDGDKNQKNWSRIRNTFSVCPYVRRKDLPNDVSVLTTIRFFFFPKSQTKSRLLVLKIILPFIVETRMWRASPTV